jgi:hypothetical protein
MFTDKETILQCKEDDSIQIQNQEEEDEEDDDEVISNLRQEVEKRKEANEKK